MFFSVRGVRPGGGLLFSGPFPCWQSRLWRSAEPHVTEDIEIIGNCTSCRSKESC